jgi:hypothetical protein
VGQSNPRFHLDPVLPEATLMAFFRNSAVNLLNLHYAIHTIALSGGAAFFLISLM